MKKKKTKLPFLDEELDRIIERKIAYKMIGLRYELEELRKVIVACLEKFRDEMKK